MNTSQHERYTLKQYTRLIISFFGCLLVLSVAQYTTLYLNGVIDIIFGTSFFIAAVHQTGFASIVGLVLVFPFNFWENLRPRYGFHLVVTILLFLLIIEALLIGFYCTALVPFGFDLKGDNLMAVLVAVADSGGFWMYASAVICIAVITGLFFELYRITSKYYHHISRMYPFTIILFSLFIMTLFMTGKPINQNKTQYLAINLYQASKLESRSETSKSLVAKVKTNNKAALDSLSIQTVPKERFTNSETVWIHSMYNGQNYDKAHLIARDLALASEYEKALLLCRYILSKSPNHIDTRILTGRINAWMGNYEKSIEILRECATLNPSYSDSYAALFDVFFWSEKSEEALDLVDIVQQKDMDCMEISDMISRALEQAEKLKRIPADSVSIGKQEPNLKETHGS